MFFTNKISRNYLFPIKYKRHLNTYNLFYNA